MIGAVELNELEPAILSASNAGYDCCQVNLFRTGWDEARIEIIANLLRRHALPAAAIGCYMNPLKPDDPELMGANLNDFKAILQYGKRLGANKIVLWSGTFANDLLASHPENQTDTAMRLLLDVFRNEMLPIAQAGDWQILIEPWHTHALGSEERLLEFIHRFPSEMRSHLAVVLDAPNLLNPKRYANRKEETRNIVETLAPVIGLVHLKDIVYDEQGQLDLPAPGKGALDYANYWKCIKTYIPKEIPLIAEHMPPSQFASVKRFLDEISGA